MEHLNTLNPIVANEKDNPDSSSSDTAFRTPPARNIRVSSTRHRRIFQNYRLVWLHDSFDPTKNDTFIHTIEQLRQIVYNLATFTDIDKCIEFITNVTNEKIFFVCSEELGQTIVPFIHEITQINAIYILSTNQSPHENWTQSWTKIKGIYTDTNHICKAIKDDIKVCDYNLVSISFVKKTDDGKRQDLDTLDSFFMYTQIMKEILLTIEFDQSHINEFLTYCREQFLDNNAELRNIAKIEKEYSDHQPIWWYTYNCFLYSMLNRVLRLMEVDLIIKMGFFLKDLHNNIATLHTQQYGATDHSDSFIVYRGQGLSRIDFDELQQTQGGLLSFNNFLSTSFDRNVSVMYAQSNAENRDLVGVLFEITIYPSTSLSPFANIKDISYFEQEEEILFSMHSIFRIEQVKQIEKNNRLWQVDLTLTNDTDPQLLSLTERIREETEGSYNRMDSTREIDDNSSGIQQS